MQFSGKILLVTAFVIVVNPVQAQKEYDLLGKGARAAGMAYAFNAIADDATAMSWNPAGMVQIKRPEFAFANVLTTTEYNHIFYSDNDYKPQYNIDYAGLVYPMKLRRKDLVFGFSFQNRINYKSAYSTGNDTTLGNSNYKNKVTVNSISICAAYSVTRFIGVGFSYNHWFSLGNRSDEYAFYNTRDWSDKIKYPYDQNIVETAETYKYSGGNVNAGILLNFTSFHVPLRFALKYESKFVLKNDYYANYQLDYQYDNNVDTLRAETYEGIEKYFFPSILSAGISYRFGDYFTIACDYDIRPFKNNTYSYDYSYVKSETTTHTDTLNHGVFNDVYYLLKDNENLLQFRIGAEYIFHPKFALIPVRVGWKNNPTSISDQVSLEQVFARSLNFGTGIIKKHFSIDLAYERYIYNRDVIILDDQYSEDKIFHFLILSVIVSL